MFKKSSLAIAIISSLTLSACLKVEDSDSKDTIVVEYAKGTVQVYFEVKDFITKDTINDVSARYQIAGKWSDAISVVDGGISLEGLPGNSDVILSISSDNDAYLDRTFLFKTQSVAQGEKSVQNLSHVTLFKAQQSQFEILDNMNQVVDGIDISYSTTRDLTSGYYANHSDFLTVATFDDQTGKYSIDLPVGINFEVSFNGDIDKDGIDDYVINADYYGDPDAISSKDLMDAEVIYAETMSRFNDFPVKIKLINKANEAIIANDAIFIDSEYQYPESLNYDEQQQVYTFDYLGSGYKTVKISQITQDETIYHGGEITLQPTIDGAYINFSDLGNSNREYRFNDLGELEIMVLLKEQNTSSQHLSSLSSYVNPHFNSLNIFFSKPVQLSDDSISLTFKDGISAIRGNDSSQDSVPPGMTLMKTGKELAFTSALSYNNSFLTVTPTDAQLAPGEYKYQVKNVLQEDGISRFNFDSSKTFYIADTTDFNIDSLVADNNNGFHQDKLIVAENSAGIADESQASYSSTSIYMPTSIETLDYFYLAVLSKIKNNQETEVYNRYYVVKEGDIKVDKKHLFSLAQNEEIKWEGGAVSLHEGTSLENGEMYILDSSYNSLGNFNDNTPENENSLTFYYEYRVKGSDKVMSGTKKLFVQ